MASKSKRHPASTIGLAGVVRTKRKRPAPKTRMLRPANEAAPQWDGPVTWLVKLDVQCHGDLMWDPGVGAMVERRFSQTVPLHDDLTREQAIGKARRTTKKLFPTSTVHLLAAWRKGETMPQAANDTPTPAVVPHLANTTRASTVTKRSRTGTREHAYDPNMEGRTACGFKLKPDDKIHTTPATKDTVECVMCLSWMGKRRIG